MMKNIYSLLLTVLPVSVSAAFALEVAELKLPMTRDEADALSKDYTYEVLSDASVRRTWLPEDRRVAVDFNVQTNEAICITVTYDAGVTRKEALADAEKLAGGKVKDPKWRAVKSEAASKFGMKNAEALALSDGSYLFREVEADKKKRITRLSLYAAMPKTNRWEFSPVDASGGKTAMGSSSAGGAFREIHRDEARRQGTPAAVAVNSTVAAEDTGVSTPTVTTTVKVKPAGKPVSKPAAPVDATPAATPQTADVPVAVDAPTTEAAPTPEKRSLMSALGLDNPGPVQYGVIGALALIVLIIIGSCISSARRRARQRAQYAAVLMQNSTRTGLPTLRKRQ